MAGVTTEEDLEYDDIVIAMKVLSETQFREPPSLDKLVKSAEERNKQNLPEVSKRHGLRLPPESECQIQPNYVVQVSWCGW